MTQDETSTPRRFRAKIEYAPESQGDTAPWRAAIWTDGEGADASCLRILYGPTRADVLQRAREWVELREQTKHEPEWVEL